MITREQIRNLLDHPVYDGDGNKIGEASHVFFDDVTGRPEWVSVKTGMFGSKECFVPIRDASWSRTTSRSRTARTRSRTPPVSTSTPADTCRRPRSTASTTTTASTGTTS
ncbi:hypothetical protein SFUMM280S_00407 [Streptomyces fumanus]